MAAAGVNVRSTRTVVDRYVRFRVGKDSKRHGPSHKLNGHITRSADSGNDSFDCSANGRVEDQVEGPGVGLSSTNDTVHRRTVGRTIGHHHVNGSVLNQFDAELSPEFDRVLRALTDEFEQLYEEAFRCACNELFLTPENAQAVFLTTINSLFSDQVISWGRIVAVLAFSGAVAAECVNKEMPNLVDQIITWTIAFIDQRLASWIQQNDGWNGLVMFYENGPAHTDAPGWPTLKTLCGCAVGALGVLTLGALLVQK